MVMVRMMKTVSKLQTVIRILSHHLSQILTRRLWIRFKSLWKGTKQYKIHTVWQKYWITQKRKIQILPQMPTNHRMKMTPRRGKVYCHHHLSREIEMTLIIWNLWGPSSQIILLSKRRWRTRRCILVREQPQIAFLLRLKSKQISIDLKMQSSRRRMINKNWTRVKNWTWNKRKIW